MSQTLANVTSFVRSLIGESTARYWTDAEITLYLNIAMSKVQSEFFQRLWFIKKTVADFAVTLNTTLYAFPTDAFFIYGFQEKSTGKGLRKIDEEDYWQYAAADAGDPTAWMLQGGQIRLVPTPASTDSDYLLCWYMKNLTISTTTIAVTDFPDTLKSLIGIETVILSRGKDNSVTPDILELRKMYASVASSELSTLASMAQDFV